MICRLSLRGCDFSATNNTNLHEFGGCAIFVFVREIRGNKKFPILIRLPSLLRRACLFCGRKQSTRLAALLSRRGCDFTRTCRSFCDQLDFCLRNERYFADVWILTCDLGNTKIEFQCRCLAHGQLNILRRENAGRQKKRANNSNCRDCRQEELKGKSLHCFTLFQNVAYDGV